MTTWIVLGGGVWLAFSAGLYLLAIRPTQKFYDSLFDIQKKAYSSIDGGRAVEVTPKKGLRLAYYISRDKEKFLHRVQGYAPGKSQQFLIDNMIRVVGKLANNFKRVGLGEGPYLDIREAGGGSHLISYSLTEEQHRRMAPLFRDRVKRPFKKAGIAYKAAVPKKLTIPICDPLPEIKG